MFALVLILLFVVICLLAAGIMRPTSLNWAFRGNSSRKKVFSVFGLGAIVLFIILTVITPGSQDSAVSVSSAPVASTPSSPVSQPVAQTDQQKLEAVARAALSDNGALQVSFKEAVIEKDDPIRPKGSRFVTVDLNTGDFFNKDEFVQDSSKVSSAIFQNAFPVNGSFYDVLVRYFGATKDAYGNTKDDLIMSYTIDRPTAAKINWQGFDRESLCSFLKQESSAQGGNAYVGCNMLVNIQ